jgi:hypothetical protein
MKILILLVLCIVNVDLFHGIFSQTLQELTLTTYNLGYMKT